MALKRNEKENPGEIKNLRLPQYYNNRELSWLLFNTRILNEARDKANPLLERVKFLSITASNLDEFFMVRVASLKDMENVGYDKPDIAGMDPAMQLSEIGKSVHKLVDQQYNTYGRSLQPLLTKNGLEIVGSHEELTGEEGEYVDRYFKDTVYPVLTPMAVDSSRPFPLIRNKTLNIGALLHKKNSKSKKKKNLEFATVQVPGVLPRIVVLPSGKDKKRIILLEQIIERNIQQLFLNYDVICAHPFRIMRNADLTIDEDEAEDLLKEIEKQIKKRQWGQAIRLEVEADIEKELLDVLEKELGIKEDEIYRIPGPLDLTFLMKLYGMKGFNELKAMPHKPAQVPELEGEGDIFSKIKKGDILLHHPYQTFEPVVEFIKQAAIDPDVLAIKQTLYRVSGNSPIIASLAQAAENGKQVSVLVELKARFDEENNIVWARKLEKAGCHVIYGLKGLKTHSKIALVVRREEDGIARYVHLGTGNYNDATAKLYTDLGLLTCQESIGEDATAVFNMLSGYSEPLYWNKLVLAPLWMKDRFTELIQKERDNVIEGKEGRIIAKVNSLCDPDIIAELYDASRHGVKIDLIVRGICCLKTGIEGVSENITVRSVTGNFLEHSRIFYFGNNNEPKVFLASADWMPRNLERRVEILFPIESEGIKNEVMDILNTYLEDTDRSSILGADGSYEKIDKRGKERLDCQNFFSDHAKSKEKSKIKIDNPRVFIPQSNPE